MKAFAELLERLTFSPGRTAKIALLRQYFAHQPDPDRGYGLAAITGTLALRTARPALLRELAAERSDATLFAWSYDYVGDLAETVALLWPDSAGGGMPGLAAVVEALQQTAKPALPALLAGLLDAGDASERLALLKLITGGLRVGVSARLAKVALAALAEGRASVDAIDEVWHAQRPPYGALFAWIEGRAPPPEASGAAHFRPPMLAHPLSAAEHGAITPALYRAEWKWDGIRVQIAAASAPARLFSRGAEDISAAFPDVLAAVDFNAVLDGELLIRHGEGIGSFADLQQRLNRKAPGAKLLAQYPAMVRLYDILFEAGEDLRPLPFDARRARLEAWFARIAPAGMDLSPLVPFADFAALAALHAAARAEAIEGLMLKRRDSAYLAGRVRGAWWKWKRDPLRIDAVLMYAQRGHGRRGSFYSDYTFGLWREGVLVPVGKAYAGYTDAELLLLDRWIRAHTIARFGPVREVAPALVLEIAFDGAQRSSRHKSGVALRFPRIARLRMDKPAEEADQLEVLLRLLA